MCHDNMTDAQKRLFDNIVNPVKVGPRVKGRFKLRAMKGDIIMRETAWCPNLVLNEYFDHLFTSTGDSGPRGFIAGAGTSTPLETDTALQSYLGGGNSFQEAWRVVNSTVAPRSITCGWRIRAAEGAVVGNVSEVGLYYASSNSSLAPASNRSLMNRARVVDELGNPTSISVLSDEFLEVVWEVIVYSIDSATGTLTINIDGTPTDFDYEIRAISMERPQMQITNRGVTGGYNFHPGGLVNVAGVNADRTMALPLDTFWPVSSSDAPADITTANASAFTGRTLAPYVAASKQRLSTIRLPLNNGNHAEGVRSIILALGNTSTNFWFAHQMLLDGPFEKKPTHIFDLPVNVSMGNA